VTTDILFKHLCNAAQIFWAHSTFNRQQGMGHRLDIAGFCREAAKPEVLSLGAVINSNSVKCCSDFILVPVSAEHCNQ